MGESGTVGHSGPVMMRLHGDRAALRPEGLTTRPHTDLYLLIDSGRRLQASLDLPFLFPNDTLKRPNFMFPYNLWDTEQVLLTSVPESMS